LSRRFEPTSAKGVSRLEPLPPHRILAESLGLSTGTIAKAYAEAERLGLVEARVGSGTYVRARLRRGGRDGNRASEAVQLGLNVPPADHGRDEVAAALRRVLARPNDLLDYLPHSGLPAHRGLAARWIAATTSWEVSPEQVHVTHGAQHALSLSFGILTSRGDVLLTECLTYSGVKTLASTRGLGLKGVAMDEEGMRPDALDAAARQTGSRVVYLMPTLQSAASTTMSVERRREIAAVLQRRDLVAIEDDVYGFLAERPLPPVAAFAPERTILVTSLSKCLAPGVRIGFLAAPRIISDQIPSALRASIWGASALMAEACLDLFESGALAELAAARRVQAEERLALAAGTLALPEPLPKPAGFHVWLPLPADIAAASAVAAARERNVILTPPEAVSVDSSSPNGIRLCLGGADGLEELRAALHTVREVVRSGAATTVSVV
jgi:DNA-binding transcriptional MocR family regulator